jgi:hypothetical protein
VLYIRWGIPKLELFIGSIRGVVSAEYCNIKSKVEIDVLSDGTFQKAMFGRERAGRVAESNCGLCDTLWLKFTRLRPGSLRPPH